MKKLVVSLREEIDARLRQYVEERYNNRRGAISIIVEEAITDYLEKNETNISSK